MFEWDVYEDYEAYDNALEPVGQLVRRYRPGEDLGLVGAVAKLKDGDGRGLLDFARAWGLLEHHEEERQSNALPWIWGHARNFRLVLDLCEYVWKRNWPGLRQFLEPYHRRFEETEPDGSLTLHNELQIPVAYPSMTQVVVMLPYPTDEDSARLAAQAIVAETLTANLSGLQHGVAIEPLRLVPRFSRLLDVAYWQLANAVTGRGFGPITRCEECGNFFVQTDRRQRFCPPVEKGKQSACGARFRKRRLRQRKRG